MCSTHTLQVPNIPAPQPIYSALARPLHSFTQHVCTIPHKTRAHTHTHIHNTWHYSTWQQKKKLVFPHINTTLKFLCDITQKRCIRSTKLNAPQTSHRAQSAQNKLQYHVQWLQKIRQSEGKSLIKIKTNEYCPTLHKPSNNTSLDESSTHTLHLLNYWRDTPVRSL